jgi:hypothetical protein
LLVHWVNNDNSRTEKSLHATSPILKTYLLSLLISVTGAHASTTHLTRSLPTSRSMSKSELWISE